jgi:hypothetical protein
MSNAAPYLDDDQVFRFEELLPGDVVVDWGQDQASRNRWGNCWKEDGIEIGQRQGDKIMEASGRVFSRLDSQPQENWWARIRRRSQNPCGEVTSKKQIDEYPHVCVRCGGKSYVGFLAVIHAPGYGEGCPARRD